MRSQTIIIMLEFFRMGNQLQKAISCTLLMVLLVLLKAQLVGSQKT
uniref:Uncharacterized protein n=1 Tax=Rhizophora mucronata TaxID=61149 RepID=A0A2P2PIM6_RHIMU